MPSDFREVARFQFPIGDEQNVSQEPCRICLVQFEKAERRLEVRDGDKVLKTFIVDDEQDQSAEAHEFARQVQRDEDAKLRPTEPEPAQG